MVREFRGSLVRGEVCVVFVQLVDHANRSSGDTKRMECFSLEEWASNCSLWHPPFVALVVDEMNKMRATSRMKSPVILHVGSV